MTTKSHHLMTACAIGYAARLTFASIGQDTPQAENVMDVPTLTAWGKVFSVLLLAALGVAYLVWRRPVMQAQAVLETSPLGAPQIQGDMVDWRRYFKTLIVVEIAAAAAIAVYSINFSPLSTTDKLGVMTSGAIVALVIHLVLLARSGSRSDAPLDRRPRL